MRKRTTGPSIAGAVAAPRPESSPALPLIGDPFSWDEIKTGERSLVTPAMYQRQRAGVRSGSVAAAREKDVILAFSGSMYAAAARALEDSASGRTDRDPRLAVFTFDGGARIALACSGVGAPAVTNAIEMLRSRGARRIVALGNAAGIGASCASARITIPSFAISGVGATRYYLQGGWVFLPDEGLAGKLRGEAGPSHDAGGVFSTDALFRESLPLVRKLERLHVSCIDQEMAAVFALGCHYSQAARAGLAVAGILVHADRFRANRWIPAQQAMSSGDWHETTTTAVRAARRALTGEA